MRAALYIRVSTKEQAEQGYSLDAQRRACRAHAESMGWHIVIDEWDDESGKRSDRQGLQRLLTAVRTRQVDVVLVHNLDRFMRNLRLLLNFKYDLDQARVRFVSLIDKIDTSTPEGILQFQLKGMLAEWYSNNLSRETSKGLTEKARQGYWVGPVPYGYQRADKTLLPSDVTVPGAPSSVAVAVARLFEQYATGLHSDESLAAAMNAAGYRTLNWQTGQWGLFGRESVRAILTNRAYLGYVSSGGVEYPGQHPPLISADLFQQVQLVRAARTCAAFKVHPKDGELLTGRVWCADCGARMHRHWTGRDSSRTARYRCSGPRNANERRTLCAAPMVVADWIEQEILQLLSQLHITPAVRALIEDVARDMEAQDHRAIDRATITAKLERLGEVYADGLISKEKYRQERTTLLAQLTEADQDTAPRGPRLDLVIALAHDLPRLLRAATKDEARAIIAPVLSHVWVQNRAVAAITPTAAFEPLLVGVWRSEVVMGCPTGFEPATS
jgi:site-specific DNA recombinase